MSASPSLALPPLALTMGEPGGVGPEITQAAWRALKNDGPAFYVIGPAALFKSEVCPTRTIQSASDAGAVFAQALPVLETPETKSAQNAKPGVASPKTASAVIHSIERAVADVFDGEASGVVTNPIQKAALQSAGFQYPGHTEFLGALCAARTGAPARAIMMLAGPHLRTVPATIHDPVRVAADKLNAPDLTEIIVSVANSLKRDFGIAAPRIAVSGLNPHAGEGGKIGEEDIRVIKPAIEAACAQGVDARGPLSADTMFHAEARDSYDAAVCMLHDQALIPVKMLNFHDAVNVTLGLPIVRTSPDHGTALDIAGTGQARADSLIAAIKRAAEIAVRRAENRHAS